MPKRRSRDNLANAQKRAERTEAVAARDADRTRTAVGKHKGDAAADELVVPVVAEELRVGKRTVETGRVRVTKQVREHEEVIDQPLLKTNVIVERVPVNQYVKEAPSVRQEGDTLVVPMVEEVVVVEKRLVLREELRITKQQVETRHPQRVSVRREEVKIDRIKGEEGRDGGTAVAKDQRSRRA